MTACYISDAVKNIVELFLLEHTNIISEGVGRHYNTNVLLVYWNVDKLLDLKMLNCLHRMKSNNIYGK